MANRSNLEIVKGIYDAFGRGDIPAVLAVLAPDIEWTEAKGFPTGGTYHGPQAVVESVFKRLGKEWRSFKSSPDEFLAADDAVAVLGTYSGTYKATGKSFQAPFAHVWWLQNGKAIRFRQYTDTLLVNEAVKG
jgi:hypothetical protein